MKKNLNIYAVWINKDHNEILYKTFDSYAEAKTYAKKLKTLKRYEDFRKNADAITICGWDLLDDEIYDSNTEIIALRI